MFTGLPHKIKQMLLDQLGHSPHHQHIDELIYLSPFRKETTPSFSVNTERNIWHDFGHGGGNVHDFIMEYYSLSNISAALGQLEELMGQLRLNPPPPPIVTKSTNNPLEVQKIQPLQNRALTGYLKQRGISTGTARPYVKEIYYRRKGKNYFALAFLNESRGYELRNPYFKGVHGKKDISVIGKKELLAKRKMGGRTEAVTVFEGFIDFLSALTYYGRDINTPVIVLNSVTMKEKAVETIREMGVSQVYLYLDHDNSGRELTEDKKQHLHAVMNIVDNSNLYAGHKDFNEFLVKTCLQEGKIPPFIFF